MTARGAFRRLDTNADRTSMTIDGQSLDPSRVNIVEQWSSRAPDGTPTGARAAGVWIDNERQFDIQVYIDLQWFLTVPGRNGLTESMYESMNRNP